MDINSIKIYPNPSKDYFNLINSELEMINIEITDVLGNKVFSATSQDRIITIDFTKISSGIYIDTIQTYNKKYYLKLLKTE